MTDLEQLDCMGDRTFDTIHIFYVRSGQKSIKDILTNVVSIPQSIIRKYLSEGFMLGEERKKTMKCETMQ